MTREFCCVSIPLELSCYQKVQKLTAMEYEPPICELKPNVKINKSTKGDIESVEYSLSNFMNKKVFYKGASIKKIDYYKKQMLYLQEEYSDEKLTKKNMYNFDTLVSTTRFKYNSKGKIVEIKKNINSDEYIAIYGYDDLSRVNSRKIYVNGKLLIDQSYRFDILDRILEYVDANQRIKVKKIDRNNQLISYVITDKMGNEISITNKFTDSSYVSTEVALNGHITTVCDTSYVDNVMLKKPYTDENDLDLIISDLLRNVYNSFEQTNDSKQNQELKVSQSGIEYRSLPISMRKRVMYNIAQGLT